MAINDTTATARGNVNNPVASGSNVPPQNQQPPLNNGQSAPQAWSLHSGGFLSGPVGQGVGSETLVKLVKNLQDIYLQAPKDVEIVVFPIDNVNEPALAYSVVVVAARLRTNASIGVAFHTLVIESTGDVVAPIFMNVRNAQVEVHRNTGDALDDVVVAKATAKLGELFPGAKSWSTDGFVIPRDFNPEDKNRCHMVAHTAGIACTTELQTRLPAFRDINLANLEKDSNLVVNITTQGSQVEDIVGKPIRSDVMISFSSQRRNQQGANNIRASLNSGDREAKVSQINGFVDVFWNPAAQNTGYNNIYQQQNQMLTQKYMARLIITNLQSSFSYSPASVLLSLATSMSLYTDNNWIQAFRPRAVNNGEIDLRDIGALNIEGKLDKIRPETMPEYNNPHVFSKIADTKGKDFGLEDLGRFVAALISPGLVISLDVPTCGPETWYQSVFAAASYGNPDAEARIYQAAMDLTNGAFGKYFQRGAPMFMDQGNRIHMGHWRDRSGATRDIRDIDYIAVANLVGENNPQAIRDWSDTFLNQNFSLAERLSGRKKMLMSLASDVVITDYAERVTPSKLFMAALMNGIMETGFLTSTVTPLSAQDFNNQRGVGAFADGALIQNVNTFMRRDQGAAYGQPNQFQGYNRW